ncbi:hypothetical protein [Microvirga pakistanensis]|uniref:hypothetical protein n=1 Tax=Microvirga pakistanensis TaxID=1682650 RepID=UPI00106C7A72|nr:hypothetical protein [Microvirga pakistanensis]
MRSAVLSILGLVAFSGLSHAQTADGTTHRGTMGVVLGNLPLTNSQNLVAGQLWDQGVRAAQQAINPNTQSYAISNAHAGMRATSSSSSSGTTNTVRNGDSRSGTKTETNSGRNDFEIWGDATFDVMTKNGIGTAWGHNSGNVGSSTTLNHGSSISTTTSASSTNSSSSSSAAAITGGSVRR